MSAIISGGLSGAGYMVKRVPRHAYDWLYILAADGAEYLIEE